MKKMQYSGIASSHGSNHITKTFRVNRRKPLRYGVAAVDLWREANPQGGKEPSTPTEPNPTQQRAVINYGDKQHCLAWSLQAGCCYV